ncbi:MAG: ABC transporter ATP-binding protein [Alphaproteobacteria bacterium]|nr:ABC transporter ATP-binding protein [Alphaproteobacteria bacterium]
MSGAALLALRGLTVSYPGPDSARSRALDGVDFAVGAGESVALIGASGSGKSTLALALLGLLPRAAQAAGDLAWKGRPAAFGGRDHAALRGGAIGYVPQEAAASLNPYLRAGVQVAEAVRGGDRTARRDRALALLARAAVEDPAVVASRHPHALSGGQCQRVAIACATANDPDLLVADEPTSALDPVAAADVLRLLVDLTRGRGGALVLVTHDFAAASRADRVVVLDRGRVVEEGRPAQLLAAPRAAATQRLVAAARLLARAA